LGFKGLKAIHNVDIFCTQFLLQLLSVTFLCCKYIISHTVTYYLLR